MHNNIAEHNIKKSAYLLSATLLLPSCCMLVSAKTVETRGVPRSIKASWSVLLDEFNFNELVYHIGDDLSYEWLNITFAKKIQNFTPEYHFINKFSQHRTGWCWNWNGSNGNSICYT